jgi:hypothetical protein
MHGLASSLDHFVPRSRFAFVSHTHPLDLAPIFSRVTNVAIDHRSPARKMVERLVNTFLVAVQRTSCLGCDWPDSSNATDTRSLSEQRDAHARNSGKDAVPAVHFREDEMADDSMMSDLMGTVKKVRRRKAARKAVRKAVRKKRVARRRVRKAVRKGVRKAVRRRRRVGRVARRRVRKGVRKAVRRGKRVRRVVRRRARKGARRAKRK